MHTGTLISHVADTTAFDLPGVGGTTGFGLLQPGLVTSPASPGEPTGITSPLTGWIFLTSTSSAVDASTHAPAINTISGTNNWVISVELKIITGASPWTVGTLRLAARVWAANYDGSGASYLTLPTPTGGVAQDGNGWVQGLSTTGLTSGASKTITMNSMGVQTFSDKTMFLELGLVVGTVGALTSRVQISTNTAVQLSFTKQFNYDATASESVSAPTDAIGRSFVAIRGLDESVAAPTDALGRGFGAVRGFSESIAAPTDGLARAAAFVRGSSESAGCSDGLGRSIVVSRVLSESVAAPSDGLSRALATARALSESIAAPTDGLVRAAQYRRSPTESIAAPTDGVSRSAQLSRGVGESIAAPTDNISRAARFGRAVTEAIAAPTDILVRALSTTRSVVENIAAPIDVVGRAVAWLRGFFEDVPAPTDAVRTKLVRPPVCSQLSVEPAATADVSLAAAATATCEVALAATAEIWIEAC